MYEKLLAYAFLLGAGFPAGDDYAAWLRSICGAGCTDPLVKELEGMIGDNAQTVRCIYLNTDIAALDPDTLGRVLMQLLQTAFQQTDLHTFSIRMLAIWECLRDLKQTQPFVRLSAADDPAISCNHELLHAHFEQMLHYYDAPASGAAERCPADEPPPAAAPAQTSQPTASAVFPRHHRLQIRDAFEVGGEELRSGRVWLQFGLLALVLLPFAAAWIMLDSAEAQMRAAVLTLTILVLGLVGGIGQYRRMHRTPITIENDTLCFRGKVWHANEITLLQYGSFGRIRLMVGKTVICKCSLEALNADRLTEWAKRRGIPTQDRS